MARMAGAEELHGIPGLGLWQSPVAADGSAALPACLDDLHPEDRPRLAEAIEVALAGGNGLAIEVRLQPADGMVRVLSVHAAVERDAHGAPRRLAGACLDITQWRQMQLALEERDADLRAILQTAPHAMIIVDERGVIQAFSRAAERMFGYDAGEAVGRNVAVLMAEPDRTRHDAYMDRYMTTGERRIIGIGRVVTGRRKDGALFPIHLTIGEIDRRPGSRRFTGFLQDLTEREASKKRMAELQAELLHVSRLGDMGQMASAMAHELNQPLTASAAAMRAAERMLGRTDSGKAGSGKVGGGPQARAQLADAIALASDQVLRAGQIVRRLRSFVDKGRAERQPEDMARLIEDAAALALVGVTQSGVAVRLELDRRAAPMLVDRVQIQQVLVNLMRNAVEAMCAEGTDPARARELTVTMRGAAAAAGAVEITVADTGPGVAPHIAARLFEPFVTSKPEGMGVGLSICQSIVQAHGGRLWMEPRPGGGSLFRFTLPNLADEASGK